MPTFKIAGQPAHMWIPRERVLSMETSPSGITTNVRAILATKDGEKLGMFEVEGRCDMLGAAMDAGAPVEVGQ